MGYFFNVNPAEDDLKVDVSLAYRCETAVTIRRYLVHISEIHWNIKWVPVYWLTCSITSSRSKGY